MTHGALASPAQQHQTRIYPRKSGSSGSTKAL